MNKLGSYYERNKQQRLEYGKKWYRENREKCLAYYRERMKKPIEKEKKKLRDKKRKKRFFPFRYHGNTLASKISIFLRAKNEAKRRNKKWDISFDEYFSIFRTPCYYCNVPMPNKSPIGLDRIDNEKGYISGNVVSCCRRCNSIKGARRKTKIDLICSLKFGNIFSKNLNN